MSLYPHLLSPLRLGGVTVPNRALMGSMHAGLEAAMDGYDRGPLPSSARARRRRGSAEREVRWSVASAMPPRWTPCGLWRKELERRFGPDRKLGLYRCGSLISTL